MSSLSDQLEPETPIDEGNQNSRLRSTWAKVWNKDQRVNQSDETKSAGQDPLNPVQITPDPEPRTNTMHSVQRAHRNLVRHLNLPEVRQQSVQLKRSRPLATGSEDTEGFPPPKRQSMHHAITGSVPPANRQEPCQKTVGRKRGHALASGSDAEGLRDNLLKMQRVEDLKDKVDYRYVRPSNPREIQLVAEALLDTRLHFEQMLFNAAPATPEHECYAVQQQIIQNETWNFWLVGGKPPLLYCLDKWTGGFDNWYRIKALDR